MSKLRVAFLLLLAISFLVVIVNRFGCSRILPIAQRQCENREAIIENELRRIFGLVAQ
jgi:hypothetical protein